MAEKVNVYNLSEGGVQLVKDDQHMADNELRQGQNAQFGNDKSGGGIESRAGMAKFNTNAMAGAVVGFVNVPLADLRGGGGGACGSGAPYVPCSELERITPADTTIEARDGGAPWGGESWEVLADELDTTYIFMEDVSTNPNSDEASILFSIRRPIPDLSDNGYVLSITARKTSSQTCHAQVDLWAGDADVIFGGGVGGGLFTITTTMTQFNVPIPEAAIIFGRPLGFFDDPRFGIRVGPEPFGVPANAAGIEIARVEVIPPA